MMFDILAFLAVIAGIPGGAMLFLSGLVWLTSSSDEAKECYFLPYLISLPFVIASLIFLTLHFLFR